MKITQRQRILNYLREFGSITSLDAYRDLSISQLAARIFELKEEGYMFKKVTEYSTNRFGEKVHYDRYSLVEEQ